MPPSLKLTCPFPTISTAEADEVVTKGSDAHRATRALVRARETLSEELAEDDIPSLEETTAFASAWDALIDACQGWFHLPTIVDLVLGGAVLVANAVDDPAALQPLRDAARHSTPGLVLWLHHAPDAGPLLGWLKAERHVLTRLGFDWDRLDRAVRAPRPLVKFYDWRRAMRGEDPIPAGPDRDAVSEPDADAIEEDMLDAGGIEDSGEEDAEMDSETPPPADALSDDDGSSQGPKARSDSTPGAAVAGPPMPAEYTRLPEAVRGVASVQKAARDLGTATARDRKQKLEAFNCAVWAVPRADDVAVTGDERCSACSAKTQAQAECRFGEDTRTAAGKPRCRPCASSKKSCHPSGSVADRFPTRPLPLRVTQSRPSAASSVSSSTRRATASASYRASPAAAAATAAAGSSSSRGPAPSALKDRRGALPSGAGRATISNSRTRRQGGDGGLDLGRSFGGVELAAAGAHEEHDRAQLDATDRVALQVLEEALVRAQLERSLAQEREGVLRQRIAHLFAAARKGR